MEASFTCTLCWRTSYHPKDVEQGFCGNCHNYVPGIVISDVPSMPDRRYAQLWGKPNEAGIIIMPDGSLGVAARVYVPRKDIENYIALVRAAAQESNRMTQRLGTR